MKSFHCSHCHSLIFFENVECLHCGHRLAYLPRHATLAAMVEQRDGLWRALGTDRRDSYRLCRNYDGAGVCNWAVAAEDPNPLCVSCRLTRVIPELNAAGRAAWTQLESAKRRLVHGLLTLGLPLQRKDQGCPEGVIFEFLHDSTQPNGDPQRVLTGHDNGVITLNTAEADDVQRERQRLQQHEPYRTLLGHFRHEIGHYFWDRLIRDSTRLAAFRTLFGDERADYADSLRRHYERGAPATWQDSFVSAYASSHPWEDWAESWAHFLHMSDALESAAAMGLSLTPARRSDPAFSVPPDAGAVMDAGFENMIQRWLPLTYAMNNLSRGLGLPDNYPFVLSSKVIAKLRFVYETVREQRLRRGTGRARAARFARAGARTVVIAGVAALAIAGVTLLLKDLQTRRRRYRHD